MKQLLIVILCSAVALVCCTTKHADAVSDQEKESEDAVRADGIHDTVTAIDNQVNEDFNSFIDRFHSDTIFQIQRIYKVVHGYNSDEDTTLYSDSYEDRHISSDDYTWDRQNLNLYIRGLYVLATDTASGYEHAIHIKSDTVVDEQIFIPGSGTNFVLTFEIIDGEWFLTKLFSSVL